MKRWTTLDRAEIPGGGELRLMLRDTEFSIMLETTQLMNSRSAGSEEALATLTCDRLRGRKRPHILIGGLGMGFTLRAALKVLPADAKVTVAELVPAVVKWARGPMAEMFKGALDEDRRVIVYEGDVRRLIDSGSKTYDAILLDVDNGPEGLTRESNDRLYDLNGLQSALAALKPNGVLAVWSSTPSKRFTDRLRAAGYRADQIRVGANGSRGARSIIWLATPAEAAEGRQRGKGGRAPKRKGVTQVAAGRSGTKKPMMTR